MAVLNWNCRSVQHEYDQRGAETFAAHHKDAHPQQKGSMLASSLGARLSGTLRGLKEGSHHYEGNVPASMHGAPHSLQVCRLSKLGSTTMSSE